MSCRAIKKEKEERSQTKNQKKARNELNWEEARASLRVQRTDVLIYASTGTQDARRKSVFQRRVGTPVERERP